MNIEISPDAHRGLDQGCDPHRGENGPDQLTDCVLVFSDAHGLSQKEGHGYGAAEARQVMLRTNGVAVVSQKCPTVNLNTDKTKQNKKRKHHVAVIMSTFTKETRPKNCCRF